MIENTANYYSTKHTFFFGGGGAMLGLCYCSGFSPAAAGGGYSLHEVQGLLLAVPCLVASWGSRALGLQSTGSIVAQRSLMGYNPWGRKESDIPQRAWVCTYTHTHTHTHTHIS